MTYLMCAWFQYYQHSIILTNTIRQVYVFIESPSVDIIIFVFAILRALAIHRVSPYSLKSLARRTSVGYDRVGDDLIVPDITFVSTG